MYGTTTIPAGDVFQSIINNCLRRGLLLLTRLALTYPLVSIDMLVDTKT